MTTPMPMRSEHIEDHGTVQLWGCPGCGFSFDAIHVNSSDAGFDQWECPECGTTDDGDGRVVIREYKAMWRPADGS